MILSFHSFCVQMTDVPVTYVRAVYDEYDAMTARVVFLPQSSETVLSSNVPDAQIEVAKVDERHVLAHCRHSVQIGLMA